MGGKHASRSRASWIVEDNGILEIIGEPLVASADSCYEASTSVELGTGSLILMSEIAAVPRAASVRLRTTVARIGRDLFYDAFDAAAAAPHVVGTLAIVGLAPNRIAPLVAALDAAADASSTGRVGVGALPAGAFARILADDIWSVRSTLESLRDAAWADLRSRPASLHASSNDVTGRAVSQTPR